MSIKPVIKTYYTEKQLRTTSQHSLALPRKNEGTPLTIRMPGQLSAKPMRIIGPGSPPPGFLRATTSLPEWYLYWALWKTLHEQGDIRAGRHGGFYGGEHFRYQVAINGGRHSLGGNVTDFVVDFGGTHIGLWLQGDIRHLQAGPERNAIDFDLMMQNSAYMDIRPIYEANLIADPTGEQACRTCIETLGGRRYHNPAKAGTFQPTRLGRLYGGRP